MIASDRAIAEDACAALGYVLARRNGRYYVLESGDNELCAVYSASRLPRVMVFLNSKLAEAIEIAQAESTESELDPSAPPAPRSASSGSAQL